MTERKEYNTNLVHNIMDKLLDCDGITRLILITIANSLVGDCYSKIPLNKYRLHKKTGVSQCKVKKSVDHLLAKQYIVDHNGDWYLNIYKLLAMDEDRHLPERIPYKRVA
jgi:hypothetical protein